MRKVIGTVRAVSKKLHAAVGHVLSLQEFELLMQKLSSKCTESKSEGENKP